ncbi:MAG: low-specificity L-threonine aldolase [Pseudomonadota bacterium]
MPISGGKQTVIDLRSDTVTLPTTAMRAAMAGAPVGDDVYGEDPTVNALEQMAAGMLGKETALFAPSGTQSNLLALMSHCQRGDEYIVGQHAHTYKYEGGGAAVLGSIQPQPIEFESDGTLDLDKVDQYIKPDDVHFARTRLLCLENTQAGKVIPMDYLARARAFATGRGLKLHMDGARIFNAAVKLGLPVRAIAGHADSVSVCLSKGLGAPVGSVLCGDRELITRARKWRKMLGGRMRQAGILAAAGMYALEHHVERLALDHDNAALLAKGLSDVSGITVESGSGQTNMVFVRFGAPNPGRIGALKDKGILISSGERIRLVTHLDVSTEDVHRVVAAFREVLSHGV